MFPLILMLLAQPVVADKCSNRKCTVSSLNVAVPANSPTPAITVNTQTKFCMDSSCGSYLTNGLGALQWVNGVTPYMTINPGVGSSFYNGVTSLNGGFTSSLPVGSFPACSAANQGTMLYDSTDFSVRVCNSSIWAYQATALGFASFPTCDASHEGQIIYDLTNHVLRYCNNQTAGQRWAAAPNLLDTIAALPTCDASREGQIVYTRDATNPGLRVCTSFSGGGLAWTALQRSTISLVSSYLPSTFTAINTSFNTWVTVSQEGGIGIINNPYNSNIGTVLTAGVGAGNAVFAIWDDTAAATTGITVTVPCTTAAGSVVTFNSTTYVVSPATSTSNKFSIRMTANACATLPSINFITSMQSARVN